MYKALVVDDDPKIVTLISFILRKEGYIIVTASNGEEGIEMAKKESPDIMLLDLMMPGIDGYKVCEIMKADPELSRIPIIMLTALNDGKSIEEGIKKGANWYITKPFEAAHLIKRVKKLIEQKESTQT